MLRVKICGVTRPEDGMLAAQLGADAIGMVFYSGSPRCVTVGQAAEIAAGLPPWVARVGVFVDDEIAEVRDVVARVGLTAVQLQGSESPDYIRELDIRVPIIKAIGMRSGWQQRLTAYGGMPILLDHTRDGKPGGTGRSWDWNAFDPSARPAYFILAGGLNPENIAEAVTRLSPDAVDIASGVEHVPGIKDEGRLRALFDALRPFRMAGDQVS